MLMVVALFTTSMSGFSTTGNSNVDPKKAPVKNSIVGTWQLCNNDTVPIINYQGHEGVMRCKIFTEETYTVVDVQKSTNTFNGFLMGTYNIVNNVLTESIQFSHPAAAKFVGQTNPFNFKIKNDILILKYVNSSGVEIWKKIND